MDQERLDIVIMGATGFTGKYVVREAERLAKEKNFTWGIAGRRKDALKSVLEEFAPNSGTTILLILEIIFFNSFYSIIIIFFNNYILIINSR